MWCASPSDGDVLRLGHHSGGEAKWDDEQAVTGGEGCDDRRGHHQEDCPFPACGGVIAREAVASEQEDEHEEQGKQYGRCRHDAVPPSKFGGNSPYTLYIIFI